MAQIDNSRYCPYGYDQRIEVFGEKGKIATQNILKIRFKLAIHQDIIPPELNIFSFNVMLNHRNALSILFKH